MDCPKFEDLLEGGEAVDDHAAICPECRVWRDALAEVDTALTASFAEMLLPPDFRARVAARVHPLPITPALLDLAGCMGVVAALLILALCFAPDLEVGLNTILGIGSFGLLTSICFAYRAIAKA